MRKIPRLSKRSIISSGNSQSDNSSIARGNLHDDVEATEFFRDIAEYSAPSGVKKVDANVFPPESFTFSWKWQFVPPAKWIKNQSKSKTSQPKPK